jgi:hypothetical protein
MHESDKTIILWRVIYGFLLITMQHTVKLQLCDSL